MRRERPRPIAATKRATLFAVACARWRGGRPGTVALDPSRADHDEGMASLLALAVLAQSTWWVDASAVPPGDGSIFSPYTRIDHAVAQPTTLSGDTVLVLAGTYPDERIDVGGRELTIASVGGPDVTVVEGAVSGSIVTYDDFDGRSVLRGLTLRGGRGSFAPSLVATAGGAVTIGRAGVTVENCVFEDCEADFGGAISARRESAPSGLDRRLVVRESEFRATCRATRGGGADRRVRRLTADFTLPRRLHQRRLLVLETQGGAQLFGEPALDLADLMSHATDGRGRINILAADELMQAPRLYATFLLWLLSELFETLPEVGDADRPKLVFFFDEAHLLFEDAPKALVDKVEQVARLIRSKGVGVYFVTQNPADVPEDVLGQLGNRIQHALRAFTAKDRRELRQAAENYRENPDFDTEDAIREVGVGEAVTSMLEKKGVPGVVQRTLIRPPSSQLGPITEAERAAILAASPFGATYDKAVDRESAYEVLAARAETAALEAEEAEAREEEAEAHEREYATGRRYSGARVGRSSATKSRRSSRSDSVGTAFAKSFARQLGTRAGKAVVRGVLGGLFRGR